MGGAPRGSTRSVDAGAEVKAVRALARLSRLLERSCAGLSFPQYRVLAMVEAGGARASHLAERLSVARPTMTAVVDGLVERGLLSRSSVEGDRRVARIDLTPTGRRTLKTAEASMADRLDQLLEHLEDPDGVLTTLGRLHVAMEEAMAARMAGKH